ncbi:PLA2G2A [Branchiostoma lanceolatum]|uniref:Phospholipase A2 n=1 Tax=Branchiostoma lanceolatum TaxID=7740 RepID=A0A8J9ZCZ9_BRALA|nr:PLA2G2A [Branchiostoma lanceolatum]
MKPRVLCLFVLAFTGCWAFGELRLLEQLGDMIVKMTGREPWAYWDYGCWCGPGGQGAPVDETDFCCRTHDHCYDALDLPPCNWGDAETYLVPYQFNIQNKNVTCLDESGSCRRSLCECDKGLSTCLSRSTYVPAHNHMNQDVCKASAESVNAERVVPEPTKGGWNDWIDQLLGGSSRTA